MRDTALAGAVDRLRSQEVVAIKGLGGYHLAVIASSEKAAASLRARKHREDKPFAVMVKDLDTARSLCELGVTDEELLTSAGSPGRPGPSPTRGAEERRHRTIDRSR